MRRGGSEEQIETSNEAEDETMNAANTPTFTAQSDAGFPPAPPEAHQRADLEGKRLHMLDVLARQAQEMQLLLNTLDESDDLAVIRTSDGLYFGGSVVAQGVTRAVRYSMRNALALAPQVFDRAGNCGQAVPLMQALKDEIHRNSKVAEAIVHA